MYADNTTIYYVGDTVDHVTTLLNNALEELLKWCMENSLFHTQGNVRPWFYLEEASLV